MNIFREKARASPVELLYRKYASRIYSLSLRLLNDVPAAERVTTDAFVTLARLLHQRSTPKNIETLVTGITVEIARRYYGGNLRTSPAPVDGEPDGRETLQRTLDHQTLNPPALEAAIKRLPLELRFAFVLHDTEQLSHEEIANMLGWTVGLSKESLFKARMELRRLLLDRKDLTVVDEHPERSKAG